MTEDRYCCVICAKADPSENATTCRPCLARIDDNLEAIVILIRAAASHITPAVKATQGGGGKPGSKPPLDVAALDDSQAADALPLLESWEKLVREHYLLSPYGPASLLRVQRGAITPDLTLEGCTGFLRAWLMRMVEDATFPIEDLAREVADVVGRLRRYDVDRPDRAVGVPVRCMGAHRDADGRRCDWRLYTDGTAIVHCPACGTQWTPEDLLDACEFELMPASVLVLLSDDPAAARKRINNWTTRGRLTVHGDIAATGGGKRLPLYRLGEYRALAGLKFTVGESA